MLQRRKERWEFGFAVITGEMDRTASCDREGFNLCQEHNLCFRLVIVEWLTNVVPFSSNVFAKRDFAVGEVAIIDVIGSLSGFFHLKCDNVVNCETISHVFRLCQWVFVR